MAELTISADEIRSAIQNYVAEYSPDVSREEVGTVTEAGDGIARVEGLPSVMTNELLEFESGVRGLALNLDVREVGVVVLGDFAGIEQRQSVKEPLQTGIKAIDAMTPIGRGQRQLVIGDRQTGKIAIVTDTIINQKQAWETGDPSQQVRCIYVAVGQKGSTIAAIRASLEEAGAMEYTTIVAAPASEAAGFKYIAPYTGSAIGQHWMYEGKHVLIVFDDLSKQAEAYRAVSLLLRRPPGREAYPGDVFYLHSRLLERCAKLSDDLGSGSMTGLPIIETKANDISAYIPTNVISITDGQCFFESDLFNQGVRPAINVGVSVSRVGGSAQIKAMRSVGGTLRLELSQYRELEAFAAFGSENLDTTSRRQLERGARLTELLKQGQYAPFPVEEQVVSIFLGTRGHLDDVAVADVRRFESEFLAHVRRHHQGILETIRESKQFDEDTEQQVVDVVTAFKKQFTTADGSSLGHEAEADAMEADEVERESVKVTRRAQKDNAQKDNAQKDNAEKDDAKKDNAK